VHIYDYALSAIEVMSLVNPGGYCPLPLRSDLNEDCKVDFQDLVLLTEGWLQTDRYP